LEKKYFILRSINYSYSIYYTSCLFLRRDFSKYIIPILYVEKVSGNYNLFINALSSQKRLFKDDVYDRGTSNVFILQQLSFDPKQCVHPFTCMNVTLQVNNNH